MKNDTLGQIGANENWRRSRSPAGCDVYYVVLQTGPSELKSAPLLRNAEPASRMFAETSTPRQA